MANTDAPFGLRPIGHVNGSPWNGKTEEFLIADAYNTAIYFGDIVKPAAAGVIQVASAGDTLLLGVFQGCRYRATDGSYVFSPRWPASTSTFNSEGAYGLVVVDPTVVYEVQHDSDTNTPAQADIFANGDFISTHTGSSITGLSKMELDTSTITTATANLRVLGWVESPDNEKAANFAKVRVLINEHALKSTTGA